MSPYQGGGEMIGTVSFERTTYAELPFKFEAGTPDYVGIAAFGTALDYINELGIDNIAAHERALVEEATRGLLTIDGMRIFGTAEKQGWCDFVPRGRHQQLRHGTPARQTRF